MLYNLQKIENKTTAKFYPLWFFFLLKYIERNEYKLCTFESFCVIKSSQLCVTEFLEFKNLTHTYSSLEILHHHGIPNDSKGVGDH